MVLFSTKNFSIMLWRHKNKCLSFSERPCMSFLRTKTDESAGPLSHNLLFHLTYPWKKIIRLLHQTFRFSSGFMKVRFCYMWLVIMINLLQHRGFLSALPQDHLDFLNLRFHDPLVPNLGKFWILDTPPQNKKQNN